MVRGAEHSGAGIDQQPIIGRVVSPEEGRILQLIARGLRANGEVFVKCACRLVAIVDGEDVVGVRCLADQLMQSVQADEEVVFVRDAGGAGAEAIFDLHPAFGRPGIGGGEFSVEGVGYAPPQKEACHLQWETMMTMMT